MLNMNNKKQITKYKIGKGNLHLTENRLSRNKTWCAADNYNYVHHICVKGFLDSNFNQALIDKILIFLKIAPNFTLIFHKNRNF